MRTEVLVCDECGKDIGETVAGRQPPTYLMVQPSQDTMIHLHGWKCAKAYAEKRITEEGKGAPKARRAETNRDFLEVLSKEEA